MLVFVCHHKHPCVSQGYGRRRGSEAGWGKEEEVPCLQFCCGKLGGGIRVAVHCSQFPLLTLCSYPWFLLALKRLAWKWSRYQSSLSPRWGRAGSGLGFLLFMAFSLSFLFSHNALCLFLCTLYIPRPALWFNMHDKFYSYVHTHYLLDWTPPFSDSPDWQGNATLYEWQESKKATPILVVINPATAERPRLLHGRTPPAHHNPLSSLFDVRFCPPVLCWAHRHGPVPFRLPTHTTHFTQHCCTPHGHPLTAKDIGYLCW